MPADGSTRTDVSAPAGVPVSAAPPRRTAYRSGAEYLRGLRDGRRVIVAGQFVDDVTTHPWTREMARVLAGLLDQHVTGSALVAPDGTPWAYSLASSVEELSARGEAFRTIARSSGGLLGRSPDFIATVLTSWAAAAPRFGRYAENVVNYWRECRSTNLVLTHAISDPPADRYLPRQAGEEPQALRVVGERADGVVVRGAKMLATLAPFAEHLLVYPYRPLAGNEADQALCFAVPAGVAGLTMHCRPALAGDRPQDHPFARRFDEMDALCVFDDVLVPWHRVFILSDVETANRLREYTGMTAYAWHQSSARAAVKARFVFELADACAHASGRTGQPSVRQMLGQLAAMAETLRSLVLAAEAGGRRDEHGNHVCDQTPLAAAAMSNATWYPRAMELLQLIVSSGLIMHPLTVDDQPDSPSYEFFTRYFAGDRVDAAEHGRLLRAAADLAMGAFGARQVLYERVFVGPPDQFQAKFYDQYVAARQDLQVLPEIM